MFFVFNFLVFAYLTRSEINCFTQGTIRDSNYVSKEISNSREAAQFKVHIANKRNADLKSNVYDKLLTDEMLSVDHRDILKGSTETILSLSTKYNLVTPTLELKQKWPMFKYISNINEIEGKGKNQNTKRKKIKVQTSIENDDDYLDSSLTSEEQIAKKISTNQPFQVQHDTQKNIKMPRLKTDIGNYSKNELFKNKVIRMRSFPHPGIKENLAFKKAHTTGKCKSCSGSSHNKKRCTNSTPNVRTHECSRYGVTNHSCDQSLLYQSQPPFVSPMPYSFYPVYLPYSYFASEPPDIPYRVSYPQPNLLSDLKIPRKHKHKHHKHTTRLEDDLYYEDDRREKKPYDDNEYYSESKKATNKGGILYDVNQDTLIKEIVKDLKIQNDEVSKECYCSASLIISRVNRYVFALIFLAIISTLFV